MYVFLHWLGPHLCQPSYLEVITNDCLYCKEETSSWVINTSRLIVKIFMDAGISACRLSKVGLSLSKQPSTHKSGSLPLKLGVKWVCTAKYQIFLSEIGNLSPKWLVSGLEKHKIIAWKNFLQKTFSTDRLFCERLAFCFDY